MRGFYVSNDRNYSYVGARGFAKPGDYNTRILLLINGHRVNDNVYDQASVGSEFGLDVSDDRARRSHSRAGLVALRDQRGLRRRQRRHTDGQSLDGGTIHLDAGTLDTQRARAAFGERLGNGLDFAFSGSVERSGGADQLYFPAFDSPATNFGIAEDLDGEEQGGFYGRIGFKHLTVTGAYGRGTRTCRPRPSDRSSTRTTRREHDGPAFVHRRAIRSAVRRTRASRFAASWDYLSYDGVYPYAPESEGRDLLVLSDGSVGTRLTFDGRATRTLPGRQTLTVGAEFLDNLRPGSMATITTIRTSRTSRMDRSSKQGALFAQDEIAVRSWLLLTAGVRYDAYEDFSRVTPRGAVIVVPSANQSFKYLYGKAFRAPNAYELTTIALADNALVPESVDTHEFVWEQYFGESLRTSVSTYFYKASRPHHARGRRSRETRSTAWVSYESGRGQTRKGSELEAEVRLKRGIRGQASYALQRTTDEELNASLTNSPRHMTKIQLSVPGPFARSFASFELQAMSERGTVAGTIVPAQARGKSHVECADHPIARCHRLDTQPVRPRTMRTRPLTSIGRTRSCRTGGRSAWACDGHSADSSRARRSVAASLSIVVGHFGTPLLESWTLSSSHRRRSSLS